MISLRTYSIVMEEVLEACLRFLVLSVADGLFDVFLTAETKIEVLNNNTNDIIWNFLLEVRGAVVKSRTSAGSVAH